jgi:excisionase family DNA binding protein
MVMAEEKLLTVRQAAERLSVHAETIRRWLAAGRLHGTKLGGGPAGWRIRESELDRFLEQGAPTEREA